MGRHRGGFGLAVLGLVVASLSVGSTVRAKPERELTVMTQNVYLGSSLALALAATTPAQFVAAVAAIYGTMEFTDFEQRAEVIADEIAAEQPDIIGLQEVSAWTATPLRDGPTPPSFDFLAILQDALTAQGLSYEVAVESQNAEIGPAPLVAPRHGCNTAADCIVTLSDRDVILVNSRTPALHWRDPTSGQYSTQATFTPPGGAPLAFDRGWASIDVMYRGRTFRFVDTHLEVDLPTDFGTVQESQASELLAGPLAGVPNVVLVGDFNSPADGSTTDTYDILTNELVDAWSSPDLGATCCQNATLTNPTSELSTRIDLVLTRGAVTSSQPTLVLGGPLPPPAPLWASDHAGVVADIQLL